MPWGPVGRKPVATPMSPASSPAGPPRNELPTARWWPWQLRGAPLPTPPPPPQRPASCPRVVLRWHLPRDTGPAEENWGTSLATINKLASKGHSCRKGQENEARGTGWRGGRVTFPCHLWGEQENGGKGESNLSPDVCSSCESPQERENWEPMKLYAS